MFLTSSGDYNLDKAPPRYRHSRPPRGWRARNRTQQRSDSSRASSAAGVWRALLRERILSGF